MSHTIHAVNHDADEAHTLCGLPWPDVPEGHSTTDVKWVDHHVRLYGHTWCPTCLSVAHDFGVLYPCVCEFSDETLLQMQWQRRQDPKVDYVLDKIHDALGDELSPVIGISLSQSDRTLDLSLLIDLDTIPVEELAPQTQPD